MAMLRLERIFKNYGETGPINERVNLHGFIGPEVFLTKSGEVGLILEVRGVDYECLDGTAIDGLTKRLESALKLFGDDHRVYQYLFKRNNETIPYKIYGNPVVDAAIQNRIAYLGAKADTLFSLSIYYVILHQGSQLSHSLGNALAQFPKHPRKSLAELSPRFFAKKQALFLGNQITNAKPALLQSPHPLPLQPTVFVPSPLHVKPP